MSSDNPGTTTLSSPGHGQPTRRWTMLGLLAVAELLGMSLWFTASAVAPRLREVWGLDVSQAGWLTTAVLLGFVAGTAIAAVLNFADLWPSRRYFAVSATLASLANAALLIAPGFSVAVLLRFLTGLFLAGVYPPAMKMASTWFRDGRGLAIGTVVGALTVGKALPYLFEGLSVDNHRGVVLASSAGALVAAILVVLLYRDGPELFPRRAFSLRLAGDVVRHRPTRLAIGGYLGHMWELYAGWAGLSLFFHDYFVRRGDPDLRAAALAGLCAFTGIAIGGLGSVLAGLWADRFGRENVASAAMALSATCALCIGWLIDAPFWLLLPLVLVWGFSIVADSAQFSALVTEVSPQHAVGTALTLQTSVGFLLSAFTIWAMIEVETRFGWGIAFSALALGPLAGIPAMRTLRTLRTAPPARAPSHPTPR